MLALPGINSSYDGSYSVENSFVLEESAEESHNKRKNKNGKKAFFNAMRKRMSKQNDLDSAHINSSLEKEEDFMIDLDGPIDLLDDGGPHVDWHSADKNQQDQMKELSELDLRSHRKGKHLFQSHQLVFSQSDSNEKVMKLFSQSKKDKKVDSSLGLRLSLPDKIDVMTGAKSIHDENTIVTTKKLMIIESNKSALKKVLSVATRTPFKKRVPSKENQPETPNSESKRLKSLLSDNEKVSDDIINIRTSETEPSMHQISISNEDEILLHAKITLLLESYDKLLEARGNIGKMWFDFGIFVGLSRKDLENMYLEALGMKPTIPSVVGEGAHHPPPLPQAHNPFSVPVTGNPFDNALAISSETSLKSNDDSTSDIITDFKSKYPRMRRKEPKATKPHHSTIKSILDCTDDLVVEGYINETVENDENVDTDNESSATSIQIAVFSSQRQRQIIIVYRGSLVHHSKPIKSKHAYSTDSIGLNKMYSTLYFKSDTEAKLFKMIEKLSSDNPFCDIIFTGHSFGAALSLIASVRYAEKLPMMNVIAHVFGVPKIASNAFRLRAHSLPNLRIIRVEHGLDPYVQYPSVGGWENIGHTIHIDYKRNNNKYSSSNRDEDFSTVVSAYKFGKRECCQSLPLHRVWSKAQGKLDHQMEKYLHAIEQFTHLGSKWVTNFKDHEGTGILTSENEERFVV